MKKILWLALIHVLIVCSAFLYEHQDTLRSLYSRPISEWPQPSIDSGIIWTEFTPLPKENLNNSQSLEHPIVKLGKTLFFDPIISKSNQISCSSCHNPQTSWGDHLSVSVGHGHLLGTRNSISLLNVYARKSLFWDGRAASLEEQALSPIEAPHEMAMDLTKLIPKLKAISGYRKLFEEAFGDEDFSIPEVLKALASFQRTLKGQRSRFDEFMDGEYNALTDQEIRGLHLFRTKARCMNCHFGQFLTDEQFHNTGMSYYKKEYEDLGRYDFTKNPADRGKFRTPSLRDFMNTRPWMHNGLFDDISEILSLYNSGMAIARAQQFEQIPHAQHQIDPLLRPLNLSKEEISDIIAFLNAATAPKYWIKRPESLPR